MLVVIVHYWLVREIEVGEPRRGAAKRIERGEC